MNIENLQEGMMVKNYKELCRLLNQKVKSGEGKRFQLKKWKFYFEFEKQENSTKYIITKIHTKEYSKNKLSEYNFERHFHKDNLKKNQFNIPYEYCLRAGVYKIELNNRIYIGSTRCFSRRFKGHYSNSNTLPTLQMLNDGAIFSMLWKAPIKIKESDLRLRLIEKEREFIKKYEQDETYIVENVRLKNYEELELLALADKCIDEFIENKEKNKVKEPLKYMNIKVLESDYEIALEILKLNKINIKGSM
jgi:hypothetical protein